MIFWHKFSQNFAQIPYFDHDKKCELRFLGLIINFNVKNCMLNIDPLLCKFFCPCPTFNSDEKFRNHASSLIFNSGAKTKIGFYNPRRRRNHWIQVLRHHTAWWLVETANCVTRLRRIIAMGCCNDDIDLDNQECEICRLGVHRPRIEELCFKWLLLVRACRYDHYG